MPEQPIPPDEIPPDETPELAEAVPKHLLKSLRRYGTKHEPTGHFLQAVLENDLMEAISRADFESLRSIHGIAMYVFNALPSTSWGSKEKVAKWLNNKDKE